MKISKLRYQIKQAAFERQNRQQLKAIFNKVQRELGLSRLTFKLLPIRDPLYQRTLGFLISRNGAPLYYGKQVSMVPVSDSICDGYSGVRMSEESVEFAGMRLFYGRAYVNKALEVSSLLSPSGLTPEVKLIDDDLLLFKYINHPTFSYLAKSSYNIKSLFVKALLGLRELHAQNVLHLDPNWDNLFFIDPEKSPVFIDFDRDLTREISSNAPGTAIDYIMAFTAVLLTMKKFWEKFTAEDVEKMTGFFWDFLNDFERQEMSMINSSHIAILFPFFMEDRRPSKKKLVLYKGLTALEEVSGLALVPGQ